MIGYILSDSIHSTQRRFTAKPNQAALAINPGVGLVLDRPFLKLSYC